MSMYRRTVIQSPDAAVNQPGTVHIMCCQDDTRTMCRIDAANLGTDTSGPECVVCADLEQTLQQTHVCPITQEVCEE